MHKVVIVGKPNVGKSTFFNHLIHKRKSIVQDTPGVTRDRIYGNVEWLGKQFTLIDTGGLTIKDQPYAKNIAMQVDYAIDEAQLILLMVSLKDGINADDMMIAKKLKKQHQKKVILVVNKSENNQNDMTKAFYALGFGAPYYISSEHAIGTGDLLDAIVQELKIDETKQTLTSDESRIKFCIIGKPNVGKSTLVNAVLHEERVLVSPIANTTRDAIDCDFNYDNQPYTIIDTAGIRKKGKVYDAIEKYAVYRAYDAIGRANFILMMVDASVDFSEQDEIIAGLAYEANIPTIIVVNKWDLVNKDNHTMHQYTTLIRQRFKFLPYAPIIFISAKNHQRLNQLFTTIDKLSKQAKIQVDQTLLNDVVLKAAKVNPPSLFKGKRLIIFQATQVKGQIPTFIIYTNDPKHLHFSYARYMENTIRHAFGIDLVPITIYYKDKNARTRT